MSKTITAAIAAATLLSSGGAALAFGGEGNSSCPFGSEKCPALFAEDGSFASEEARAGFAEKTAERIARLEKELAHLKEVAAAAEAGDAEKLAELREARQAEMKVEREARRAEMAEKGFEMGGRDGFGFGFGKKNSRRGGMPSW
jgi:hypothetical protein